jgi:hypothetical protein
VIPLTDPTVAEVALRLLGMPDMRMSIDALKRAAHVGATRMPGVLATLRAAELVVDCYRGKRHDGVQLTAAGREFARGEPTPARILPPPPTGTGRMRAGVHGAPGAR